MNDEKKDKLNSENTDKTINEGNKVPNIHSVEGQYVDEDEAREGEVGGIKPTQAIPKPGGRQGGTSVEDGGQDLGSSAGSR